MNSIFSELFIFTCFLLSIFYDDDVSVRWTPCTGEMVAIEIYVHRHSFLSLQLLTENWYFAISPTNANGLLVKQEARKNVFLDMKADKQGEESGRKVKCKRDVK